MGLLTDVLLCAELQLVTEQLRALSAVVSDSKGVAGAVGSLVTREEDEDGISLSTLATLHCTEAREEGMAGLLWKASKYLPNSRGLITEPVFCIDPPVLMMDLGTR